jgi:hypothetical protein
VDGDPAGAILPLVGGLPTASVAWEAAAALKGEVHASEQYWRCLPAEAQAVFGNVRIGQR